MSELWKISEFIVQVCIVFLMPSIVDGQSIHKTEIGKDSSVFFGIYTNYRKPLFRILVQVEI